MSLKTSVIIGVVVGGIVAIAGASLALLIIKRCKSSNKDVEKTNTKFGELFAFKGIDLYILYITLLLFSF